MWIGVMGYYGCYLKKIFTTRAELFVKGFYLKHGSKEYAYAFKDISHLQKAFFYGTHHQLTAIQLVMEVSSGERVAIHES
jgi:hypothetical protein